MSEHRYNTAKADHETLRDIFGPSLHSPNRILYPQECATSVDDAVLTHFEDIKRQGQAITLVDGAFDVPHPCHNWFLRHCKTIGAEEELRKHNKSLSTSNISHMLATSAIHLAVTIDADHKVKAKKGGRESKGGIDRPVYNWLARTEQVLNYNWQDTDNTIRYVVDTATVEGDPMHADTYLEDTLALAEALRQHKLLGTMIIHEEHIVRLHESYQDAGVDPIVVPMNQSTYQKHPSGKSWRSSDIIRHIREGGMSESTRPSVDGDGHLVGQAIRGNEVT